MFIPMLLGMSYRHLCVVMFCREKESVLMVTWLLIVESISLGVFVSVLIFLLEQRGR